MFGLFLFVRVIQVVYSTLCTVIVAHICMRLYCDVTRVDHGRIGRWLRFLVDTVHHDAIATR